ncbi:ribosomal protein L16p/L10e-domain-containing protein [Entophlyctis helioformis]|nr:ribosomal protein L16p/L10e-domain-containing protein [Entophlyctis helioformis]
MLARFGLLARSNVAPAAAPLAAAASRPGSSANAHAAACALLLSRTRSAQQAASLSSLAAASSSLFRQPQQIHLHRHNQQLLQPSVCSPAAGALSPARLSAATAMPAAAPLAHTQRRFAIANFRPKKTRFRKAFKGFFKTKLGGSLRGTAVRTGEYGLQAFEGGRLKDKQLDAIRTLIRRILKKEKGAKLILRCFPHRPVSAKPLETRMGKGKGMVDYFATWVSEGRVIMEISGARKELALKALNVAAEALPIRTRIVERDDETLVAPRVVPHFVLKRLQDKEFDSYDAVRAAAAAAAGKTAGKTAGSNRKTAAARSVAAKAAAAAAAKTVAEQTVKA